MYVIYGYMKLSIMYVLRTAVTTGKKGWELDWGWATHFHYYM